MKIRRRLKKNKSKRTCQRSLPTYFFAPQTSVSILTIEILFIKTIGGGTEFKQIIEQNGEWWAILKDICDALDLRTAKIVERLDPEMMIRVKVKVSDIPSKDLRSRGDNEHRWMIAVNEIGIYEALFASRRLEARKFRRWSASVMQKLRKTVGLEGYQVMQMTDPDIQMQIDNILDSLYWDDEKKCVMRSVTVQGGDVEQVPFMK